MLLGNWWKTFAAVSWYLRTSSKFHSWLHTVHNCTCAARWLWAKVISNFLSSIFTLAGALISLLRKHALKAITTRLSWSKKVREMERSWTFSLILGFIYFGRVIRFDPLIQVWSGPFLDKGAIPPWAPRPRRGACGCSPAVPRCDIAPQKNAPISPSAT